MIVDISESAKGNLDEQQVLLRNNRRDFTAP